MCPASRAMDRAVLSSCKHTQMHIFIYMELDHYIKNLFKIPSVTRYQQTHTVRQGGIAVRLCEQESDDVCVAVLACTHQCSGALIILEVDVCPPIQEGPDHTHPTVADR